MNLTTLKASAEQAKESSAEFDALHGGRDLLPIEQIAYEAEGVERFARFHGHGRVFPKQAESVMSTPPNTQGGSE